MRISIHYITSIYILTPIKNMCCDSTKLDKTRTCVKLNKNIIYEVEKNIILLYNYIR